MRIYLDFALDESYTPTRMVFLAGMGAYDLVEFGEWTGEGPRGWVEVGLDGVGGGGGGGGSGREEGLKCMVVQVRVCENHQNGKDTHVRGVQIFARDERWRGGREGRRGKGEEGGREEEGDGGLVEPEWMAEPELR